MGFECGISIVPKYGDITFDEYEIIDIYNRWRSNQWNFEDDHYPTFKKYYETMCMESTYEGTFDDLGIDIFSDRFLQAAEFYKKYEDPVVVYVCSIGKEFDDDVLCAINQGCNVFENNFELNKQDLENMSELFAKLMEDYRLIPVDIKNSFTYGDEDNELIIKEIDGVEIQIDVDNLGHLHKRIDCSYSEDCLYYSADADKYNVYAKFCYTCKTLSYVNDHFIWYWRSY